MNRKLNKSLVITLIVCIMLTTVLSPTLAASNTIPEKAADDYNITPKLINAPASYEYKISTRNISKAQCLRLRQLSEQSYTRNTKASRIDLASFLLGFFPGVLSGNGSNALGIVSQMLKSDLDDYGTLLFAFDTYTYLDRTKQTSVKAQFKFKRFFDGFNMKPWYPYSKPVRI